MMRLLEHLLSLNFWVGVFSIIGVVGICLMVIGFFGEIPLLIVIGIWLGVPLMSMGVGLVVFVYPILIWMNCRQR